MAKSIIVENFKLENHTSLPEADARAAFARIRHNVIRKQLQTLLRQLKKVLNIISAN